MLTYILSCTVSELSSCTGQIIGFGRAASILLPQSQQNLALKTRNIIYHVVHNTFQYTELYRHGSPVWQTDRRSDSNSNRAPL